MTQILFQLALPAYFVIKHKTMRLPSHRLLIASTAVGMFILLAANWILPWPISTDQAQWEDISWAVLLPAILLLFWALVTLGWLMFQVHPGPHLVNRGPYRHIRHPFYFGLIIGFAGLALATNNWMAVLATILILWPVLVLRAMREEEDLQEQFGTEWSLYKTSTWFLIPYVW